MIYTLLVWFGNKRMEAEMKFLKLFGLSVLLILFLFLLSACQTEQAASPLSAALSELQGSVGIKAVDQPDFSPADTGSVLEQNGQVQTGDDGRVRLDLSSGTIIRMAPSSLFTLVSNETSQDGLSTKGKLDLGKLFILLSGGTIDVETPSGVASVRGSVLGIEVDPVTLDVYVYCFEGDCGADNPEGSLDFSGGEKTILFHFNPDTGQYTAPGVEDMTPEDFQKWLDENPELQELYNNAIATLTALASPEPTEPPTEPPTTNSSGPSGGGGDCFSLISPLGGANVPNQGVVNFEWEEQEGASYYILTFTSPNGATNTFTTTDTNLQRYIESLPDEGNYGWEVTAYGEDGGAICTSETFSFSKPDSFPEPPKDTHFEEPPSPPTCDPCDEGGSCYNPEDPSCGYYYAQSIVPSKLPQVVYLFLLAWLFFRPKIRK